MKECWLPALVKIDNEQISEWILNKFKTNLPKTFTHFDIWKSFKNPQEELDFFEDFLSYESISRHHFWPLIRFTATENRFRSIDNEEFIIEKKERPITYASHQDWYIFSYYSYLLSDAYEKEIINQWLSQSIIAYRSIKDSNWKGLNNIDYAQKAFKTIVENKNSLVIALDISKFFDTLDHSILKSVLINVLEVNALSNDWYRIFRRVTKFSYILKEDLGKYNLIRKSRTWNRKIVNHNKFNLIKEKLKKEWIKLVKENLWWKWIPQWTAISWLLANIYMIEFDKWIKEYSENFWWKYFRYSDDLLLIIPFKEKKDIEGLIIKITQEIPNEINGMLGLEINNKKTEISVFVDKVAIKDKIQIWDIKIQNNIQYLWFTFDWKRILIRNKTLSKFYKKMISNHKRILHLNNISPTKLTPLYKWGKIQYWEYNRKFLYNWRRKARPYKKNNYSWRWELDKEKESHYLWFLSYWYTAHDKFEPFCKKFNLINGIRKQLARHRNKYNKLKKK